MAEETGATRVNFSALVQNNVVGAAVVLAVMLLVVPLPKTLIDIAMAVNMALSIVILLNVVYTPRPTNFTTFPRVILFATLLGLGINISSTRLILSQSAASRDIARTQSAMVQAFANIVTGGSEGGQSVIVGFVIFIILIVVQVIVVAKGATRVSEVAARFSLDSMNNKMFDVDAQLNSGAITEEEARAQKAAIRRESDFYSTMDGASKFVSGNVKAGIFITVVNLVGGMIVGSAMKGLPFGEAANTYARLTIGDGLLSQVPSLMLSFATGLIVTASSSDEMLGDQLKREFAVSGQVYEIVGVTLAVMGLAFIGNGPSATVLLILIGALCFFVGYRLSRSKVAAQSRAQEEAANERTRRQQAAASPSDAVAPLDVLSLELGYALIPLVEKEKGAELLERITRIRHEAALDLGLVVPPIRIVDNVTLEPSEYSFKIRGIEAGKSAVKLGYYMCMASGKVINEVKGEKTKDPAFGMDAIWVGEDKRVEAERSGYTVIDPPTIIATHITQIIKAHASEILGRQEVSTIINRVKETNPVVVDEVFGGGGERKFTYGEVERILRSLLQEQVSVRNIVVILETIANYGAAITEMWRLVEKVREALSVQICKQYADDDGVLRVMSLGEDLTEKLAESIVQADAVSDPSLGLSPEDNREWERCAIIACNAMRSKGLQPVIYCVQGIRRVVWSSLSQIAGDDVAVLSGSEIAAAGQYIRVEVVDEINGTEGANE